MRAFFTLILSLTILCAVQTAGAETKTGYVSDMLILTFRQGPGPSYQVLKTLESNASLTILAEENGYFKVQLSSGETGWVDKQFVMFDTPKTQIIDQLQQENQALQEQLADLTAARDSGIDQQVFPTGSPDQEDRALTAALEKAQEKINTLEEEISRLSRDIALLEEQSGQVLKADMIKWFLAGFGVIFLGWILGQSVSSRRQRKKSLLG